MGKLENLLRSFCSIKDLQFDAPDDYKFVTALQQMDTEIKQKAFKEVLLVKYKSYYNSLIDAGEADDLLPILKEMREMEDSKFKSPFMWITINPYKEYKDYKKFFEIIAKVVKKSWIKKYFYVIEQRGENEDEIGRGFHTHMLVDRGEYRWSHARREFASAFNKICDVSNPGCFNFTLCKEKDLSHRMNYMIGRKADPAKWLKQDMDIIYRRTLGLQAEYGERF